MSEGPSAAQLHHAAEAMAAGAGFTEADMAALKAMMSDLKGAASTTPFVGTSLQDMRLDSCCEMLIVSRTVDMWSTMTEMICAAASTAAKSAPLHHK